MRYKNILVPLDGSNTAEVALPHAFALARLSGAEVMLLLVVPPVEPLVQADKPVIDEQWPARKARVIEYLNSLSERADCEGLTLQSAVESGPPAETILEFAAKRSIDLIVMATHGHSGMKRWLLGSVAEKVLRAADRPVLLIRAFAE